MTILEQCQQFVELWQANSIDHHGRTAYACRKRAVEKKLYINLDQDNGPDRWRGVWMVRKADGQVFPVKGYGSGVPDFKRPLGHISELIALEGGRETASVEKDENYERSITDRPAKPRKVTSVEASVLNRDMIVTYYSDGGYSERHVSHEEWQAQRDKDCRPRCGVCGAVAIYRDPRPFFERHRFLCLSHYVVGSVPLPQAIGLTPKARNILMLLDSVDVAAHALGGTPHLPEEPWLKARAELWEARKQLLQALREAKEEDLQSLRWAAELS